MTDKLYPVISVPGIKRDGTDFASRYYLDGQWCRFRGGYPRKIGGFQQIYGALPEKPTGVYMSSQNSYTTVSIGSARYLNQVIMTQFGDFVDIVDRTPTGFASNALNVWQFDEMFSTTSNDNYIIAHAAPNLGNGISLGIDSTTEAPIYYGLSSSENQFTTIGQSVSGGIVVLHPYLFIFGNNGYVQWSAASDPTDFPADNYARVTSQKIVVGMATRGGNSSPAGLLWSLDSLIRITETGSNTVEFTFDTITNQSSILSSRSVVEYDGNYFWAGIDRFLMYNGVVQEVPNSMNLQFFYFNDPNYVNVSTTPELGKSLNYAYRQNVWATKVSQYGEIWWFYPSLNSTFGECDRAIIYNVRDNCWYDTDLFSDDDTLPGGRGAGYFKQVFSYPVWAGNIADATTGQWRLWQHEVGYDKDIDGDLTAIESYFETSDISWCGVGPDEQWSGADRWVDLERVEPDFIQYGNLTLTVRGAQYAGADVEDSNSYTITTGTDSDKIDMREQLREMRLKITSNEVGGFYEMGQLLAWFRVGDERA
jgi:hypothetical protein